MKSKLRTRWIVLGCIWAAALGLTGWNLVKVDRVAAARGINESLRREIYFQRHNAQRLEQVAARHEALFMQVESLDLGIITLRDRLRALSAAFNLEELAVDADMNQIANDRIPCKLSLTGSFENTVGFLTALNKYPYLQTSQTLISSATNIYTVRLEMAFFAYCKISAPTAPADQPANVTAQPLEAEGRPL